MQRSENVKVLRRYNMVGFLCSRVGNIIKGRMREANLWDILACIENEEHQRRVGRLKERRLT
jgi:hypothetical protein